MFECSECRRLSRRNFISRTAKGFGALALADPILRNVAATYAQSTGGTGNLLVLVQLAGGLDALSFLAPYQNPVYQSKRPTLALTAAEVTPLPGRPDLGINTQFSYFNELYNQFQLAIVQQVAYPNGNGSHFESQDIYEYGVRNLGSSVGTSATWYERLRRTYFNAPFGVMDTAQVGDPRTFGYPDNTQARAAQIAFGRLARAPGQRSPMQQAVRDTYNRIDTTGTDIRSRTQSFVSTGTARGEFFRAAALASAQLGTQILKLRYGGFDTHASQEAANLQLFPRLNNEFRQFVDDLKAMGLWDRTCVVFYSEFGRRNAENGSPGTDHGHGGHIVLAGPRVNPGLHGQEVTTADLNQGSLPYYVDFRAVFSACIQNWLGFDPSPIFNLQGETFDPNVGSSLFV
jgi:uncharacterized protein (DUF1501 family)